MFWNKKKWTVPRKLWLHKVYSPVHHDPLWKLSKTSSKIMALTIKTLKQKCMTLLILEGKFTVVFGIQSGQTHTLRYKWGHGRWGDDGVG